MLAALVHSLAVAGLPTEALQDGVTIAVFTGTNWLLAGIFFSLDTGEAAIAIWRRTFTFPWLAAFTYFALSAVVISNLMDGSLRGYVMALMVFSLSFAMTDTLAGRRSLSVLIDQLADADRHLMFTRTLEGVTHNLRNHLQNIQGALDEIGTDRLTGDTPAMLAVAEVAVADAAAALTNLSAGASPRIVVSPDPIPLHSLAASSASLGQARARRKRVQVRVEIGSHVLVRGDPLQLREVASNLINNAIDAAPEGGRVVISTGHRSLSTAYLTVADNGTGVPPAQRDRLFEPHFTTKPDGTGMGLFTSFGIVREHRGELLYEGSARRGGVFTVVLPIAA